MAMPGARGNGSVGDDLYSLGVLCLHLLQGTLPARATASTR
ncbi:MAG: hypothetical protein WDN69_12620 [Aliidongia sp.]